MVKLIAFFLET